MTNLSKAQRKLEAIRATDRGALQDCDTSKVPHSLGYRLTYGGKVLGLIIRPHATHDLPPERILVLISVNG
jgi:hypothetical protein